MGFKRRLVVVVQRREDGNSNYYSSIDCSPTSGRLC
jgi:hypothetical protein